MSQAFQSSVTQFKALDKETVMAGRSHCCHKRALHKSSLAPKWKWALSAVKSPVIGYCESSRSENKSKAVNELVIDPYFLFRTITSRKDIRQLLDRDY